MFVITKESEKNKIGYYVPYMERKREKQLNYLDTEFLNNIVNLEETKFEVNFDNIDCLRITDIIAFCEENNFNFYCGSENKIILSKE